MFNCNHHDEAAMRGITDARQLLTQQEYELQRRMADLQLRAIELEHFAPTRSIPRDVAEQIEALPIHLKHSLRNAREELDEAERVLNELLNTVLSLELRHST
jgi:hypothetical protein